MTHGGANTHAGSLRADADSLMSPDEIDAAVREAQANWEGTRDQWLDVMRCVPSPFVSDWGVRRWAEANRLPVPTEEQFEAQRAATRASEEVA